MKKKSMILAAVCGISAGAVSGMFGAGGGMVLVPLLLWLTPLEDNQVFPASICIILPICIVVLLSATQSTAIPWEKTTPYLIGSAAGGVLAGLLSKHIQTSYLHRLLGLLILWGGIRYLC